VDTNLNKNTIFQRFVEKVAQRLLQKSFSIDEYLTMNTQSQMNPFLVDHFTEILHKNL